MIKVNVYGSNSDGNSYVISDGERSLMLEAGISLKRMNEVDWQSVDGCLITHEHGDHKKYVDKVIKQTGMNVFLSEGTQEVLNLPSYRSTILKPLKQQNIGSWEVLPFDVEHDVNEPLGFFIKSKDDDRLLFATDTFYVRYKFPGITHLMVECNYSLDILDENIASGRIGAYRKKRLLKSHFELENVKTFIKSNDMSQLQEVWLLHLSDANSDAARFKKEIQAITGVPVYVA